MAKKKPQNRYGIKLNDIFVENWTSEDDDRYHFYQVVALRGELTVVVRQIYKKSVAFDGRYERVVPVPDAWVTDEELVRRVQEHNSFGERKLYIIPKDFGVWSSHANLIKEDEKDEMYLEWSGGVDYPEMLRESAPEIAEQLDLKKGSGIYMIDGSFEHGLFGTAVTALAHNNEQRALLRYPDGREEEVVLSELLHRALKSRGYCKE